MPSKSHKVKNFKNAKKIEDTPIISEQPAETAKVSSARTRNPYIYAAILSLIGFAGWSIFKLNPHDFALNHSDESDVVVPEINAVQDVLSSLTQTVDNQLASTDQLPVNTTTLPASAAESDLPKPKIRIDSKPLKTEQSKKKNKTSKPVKEVKKDDSIKKLSTILITDKASDALVEKQNSKKDSVKQPSIVKEPAQKEIVKPSKTATPKVNKKLPVIKKAPQMPDNNALLHASIPLAEQRKLMVLLGKIKVNMGRLAILNKPDLSLSFSSDGQIIPSTCVRSTFFDKKSCNKEQEILKKFNLFTHMDALNDFDRQAFKKSRGASSQIENERTLEVEQAIEHLVGDKPQLQQILSSLYRYYLVTQQQSGGANCSEMTSLTIGPLLKFLMTSAIDNLTMEVITLNTPEESASTYGEEKYPFGTHEMIVLNPQAGQANSNDDEIILIETDNIASYFEELSPNAMSIDLYNALPTKKSPDGVISDGKYVGLFPINDPVGLLQRDGWAAAGSRVSRTVLNIKYLRQGLIDAGIFNTDGTFEPQYDSSALNLVGAFLKSLFDGTSAQPTSSATNQDNSDCALAFDESDAYRL